MERKLSPWCKRAQHRKIDLDLTTAKIASDLGMNRCYVSSIMNGRVFSPAAIKKISEYLEIPDTEFELTSLN